MTEGSMDDVNGTQAPTKRKGPQFPGYPGVYRVPASQYLHVSYSWRGKAFRESAHTTSVRKAAEFRRERLAGLQAGTFKSPKQDTVTLAQCLDDYLEARAKKPAIRVMRQKINGKNGIKKSIGHMLVIDLSLPFLTRWANQREALGYAPATVAQDLGWIRAALRYGVRAGTIPPGAVPPFPTIEFDNARQGAINDAEAASIAGELPVTPTGRPRTSGEVLQDCVAFIRLSGWRGTESRTLQWAWFNRHERSFILPATGTKKRMRDRPLALDYRLPSGAWANTELWRVIDRRWRARALGCPWVFPNRNGRPIELRRAWKEACGRAGVVDKRLHDFRRDAVRENENAGVSRKVGKERTGHVTDAVYERYHIVQLADQREALAKLEAYRARRRAVDAQGPVSANANVPYTVATQSAHVGTPSA
jgi:integrase